MERFFAPADGRQPRKPDGTPLAEEGELVVFDTFWQRRLDDEDVIELDPPAETPATRKGAAK